MTGRFLTSSTALVIISVLGVTGINPASSEEPSKSELDALRLSLSKYQDVYTAVHDGYYSTLGCVHYDGQKMEGHVEYPKGAMGIHFVNIALVGPNPDPLRPPVLLYEPKDGKLELIGVEWLVPMSIVKERPVLFGQSFLGPMEGHEPLIPKEFAHYDLHAWLFKENPLGMFAPTNPAVNCEGYGFTLLSHPTKLLPAL